ncbi:S9 family peptidase [Pedobacter cryophilus]|uniref:S9 family peptidase n=1 Tax=Pedobacter cryophilus TaxID=2571271 RepID=A0A4U1C0B0_9SPHI|nr:prolyl oligopeptidase family serine peptidase [Pedobacter cryophilus]TKB98922.1 S9 family peptidase [Pedobacter cryophilus]
MNLNFLFKSKFISPILFGIGLINLISAQAQENSGYKKPPQEMIDMVENAISRSVIISGKGSYMAILEEPGYPSIKEISQPVLKLAGLRINPKNMGNSRSSYYSGFKIKNLKNKDEFEFQNLPKEAKIKDVSFSPDENLVAFSVSTDTEIQLWTGDINSKTAKRLSENALNDIYGKLYEWAPDSKSILAKCLANQQEVPLRSIVPNGPNVQENLGKATPSRTYQDLLKNNDDELLFDYYLTVQMKMIFLDGQAVDFNRPNIYKSFDFSPDGTLVMTASIHKPYSYLVPIGFFPYKVDIKDRYGKEIQDLADVPLADNLPTGFDAVITGPREFGWRSDKPQTYFWVEAQDGGDPAKKVTFRDLIFTKEVGANGIRRKLADCYLRFNSINWGDDQIAIVTERWWKTRAERRVFIKPIQPLYRVNLWDRYSEDTYNDPGQFVAVKNEYNKDVLLLAYNSVRRIADANNMHIFSISEGASAKGNRPFLLKFNVKTKLTDTLFRSKAPFYEKPIFFNNRNELIISRESEIDPPNYFAVELPNNKNSQLTYFKNPYPQLFGVVKQQINYPRADKLNLSATLYLPKNYTTAQGKLPVLMWAYPKEFKTAAAAGQVKGSPFQFTKISWASPVYWVTQGYAVMDNVDMPIVGESNEQPNDSFIEQLKENAEAAINKITRMGIADPKRIAVGGHSYGAFMTANLLAHTNLFAAGIARSGAYNRTLTPFGFQAEERTYWEAPGVYNKMSPFSYANKVKTPLLLIHGEADDNSGTFPIQTERFYSALKGFGATTRLVNLPSEAHSYRAKESILHMLWEMNNWLDTYVKNKVKIAVP